MSESTMQIYVAMHAAQALTKLHEMGIVHRDISPGNLMVAQTQAVVLADFGISKICSATLGGTQCMNIHGNLAYCSPDVTDPSKLVTDRSDIWSLAATILEAMTATKPYGNADYPRILGSHFSGTKPNVPQSLGPAEFVQLLNDCFNFNAAARPSAKAVYRCLREIKDKLGLLVPSFLRAVRCFNSDAWWDCT